MTYRVLGRVLLLWAACACAVAASPPWRWSNPTPHGANIFSLASRGGVVVQVGELGQAFSSDDLELWLPLNTGVQNNLRSAVWFGPRLIVTGSAGLVLYSDSLTKFTRIDLRTPDWIEGVAASTNRLIAVGDNGAMFTSTNGEDWTRLADAAEWLRSVAFGDGKWVAVGDAGFITTSADGLNWSAGTRPVSRDLNRVVWADTRFWVLGNFGTCLISPNGANWTPVNTATTNDLFSAASNGSDVVLVGRSELRTSSSPFIFWTSRTGNYPSPPPWTYYSAIWDGAQFLAAGRSGMLAEGFKAAGGSATSWYSFNESPRNWLWSITRADPIYAACGERGGIFTSVDGYRFDQEYVPETASAEILEGIGGTTNLLIAVGTAGVILSSPGGYTNVVSTNSTGELITNQVSLLGINWNEVTPRPTANELQGIGVFGGSYIVTGGNGTILTSPDGQLWTPRLSGVSQMLSSVTASATRAVTTGDSGVVLTSDDGILWAPRNSGVTNWIYQTRYLENQFVAVGEGGLILTSPDGIAWTRRTSDTTRWLNTVAFHAGAYFAAGGQGTLLRSADAVTWTTIPFSASKSIYGLAGADGRILAVGAEGAALRSRLLPWTSPVNFLASAVQADAHVILFNGELDQRFLLQRTPDFTSWSDVAELEMIDNSGAWLFFDAAAPGSQWFFRTQSLLP